jgi:hypothetical protein
MLPYRKAALAAAAIFIANTSAQVWGGQSQQYCSNQNTGSDYSPGVYMKTALASQDMWMAILTLYSKRHLQLISGLLGSLREQLCFRNSAVPGLLVLRLHPRRPRIHR